ncbi:hypothetical protein [Mesorhizobium sp. A623]
MDITELLDAAARAAVEHGDVVAEHLKPGSDERCFVWDRIYANKEQRLRLDAKLAECVPQFRAQVAEAERHLAEEIEDTNNRLARLRAETPELYKDDN